MDFQKISSPSLQELFVQQLEHMIISGKLGIGEKLPPERKLAETMQVSRSVVHNGISMLEKKGFLVVKPRVGTVVADYRHHGTLETLVSIMNYNGGIMRNEEVRSVLEIRVALDSVASRLCIGRATDEELAHLQIPVEGIRTASDYKTAAEAAFSFQHELAILSGNTLIPLIFHSFRILVLSMWERFCSLHGIYVLYANTYQMWKYLNNRDTKGVIEWIEASMEESISGRLTIYSHEQ